MCGGNKGSISPEHAVTDSDCMKAASDNAAGEFPMMYVLDLHYVHILAQS